MAVLNYVFAALLITSQVCNADLAVRDPKVTPKPELEGRDTPGPDFIGYYYSSGKCMLNKVR